MGWTPCYSTAMEIQAYVVKGYLEQFGVPCMIENARFGMKPLPEEEPAEAGEAGEGDDPIEIESEEGG